MQNIKQNIHLKTLERAFIDSFQNTVKDYLLKKIEIEEDCRASFYHHIRPTIDKVESLQIYLSHNLTFLHQTAKPDISIVRNNKYFLCSEIKIATQVNGNLRELNVSSAKGDIERIKLFAEGFSCGYAVRIENSENSVIPDRKNAEDWMPDYFRELYYLVSSKEFYFYAVRKIKIKKGKNYTEVIKGGLLKITLKELEENKLSKLIEIKYKNKFKISLFNAQASN